MSPWFFCRKAASFNNRYAVRPDGGVLMMHVDGAKFIDSFAPDGTRVSSVQLEHPPIPFFPSQVSYIPLGRHPHFRFAIYPPGYKASTAISDPTGRLVKQLVLDGDEGIERAIVQDTRAQSQQAPLPVSQIVVVQNWSEELKRIAPTKRWPPTKPFLKTSIPTNIRTTSVLPWRITIRKQSIGES